MIFDDDQHESEKKRGEPFSKKPIINNTIKIGNKKTNPKKEKTKSIILVIARKLILSLYIKYYLIEPFVLYPLKHLLVATNLMYHV